MPIDPAAPPNPDFWITGKGSPPQPLPLEVSIVNELLKQRDPSAIYADLFESYQKGQVVHAVAHETRRDHERINLVRPAFDLDRLMNEVLLLNDNLLNASYQAGAALAAEGMLIPPGSGVALMWSQLTDNAPPSKIGGQWTERIVTVDWVDYDDRKGWLFHTFERDHDIDSGHFAKYGRMGYHWLCGPRIVVFPTYWAYEIRPGEFGPFDGPKAPREHFLTFLAWRQILGALGVIGRSPKLVEVAADARLQRVNQRQIRQRITPIPPLRRVLDLDRTLYLHNPKGSPAGWEMPAHYRRGTIRNYRHPRYVHMLGKAGSVREAYVRTDKGKVVPPLYVLKNGKEG